MCDFFVIFCLTGCEVLEPKEETKKEENYFEISKSREELSEFEFETILIYCSPSVEEPVLKIGKIFKDETNCNVQVNVANADDVENQLRKSKDGEIYISDSQVAKNGVNSFVKKCNQYAKHTPVFAVPKGSFSGIDTLDGLIDEHVTFLVCDLSNSIGKISDEFFEEYSYKYIFDSIDDYNEDDIYEGISSSEGCVGIVWKESSYDKDVDLIETQELESFSDYINVAKLKTTVNDEATNEFIEFLNSDEVKQIWKDYGYDFLK